MLGQRLKHLFVTLPQLTRVRYLTPQQTLSELNLSHQSGFQSTLNPVTFVRSFPTTLFQFRNFLQRFLEERLSRLNVPSRLETTLIQFALHLVLRKHLQYLHRLLDVPGGKLIRQCVRVQPFSIVLEVYANSNRPFGSGITRPNSRAVSIHRVSNPAISAALLVTDSLMPQASTRTDAFYHHTALQVRLQNEIGPNIASALLPKTSCSSVLNPLDSREYRFRIKPSYPV